MRQRRRNSTHHLPPLKVRGGAYIKFYTESRTGMRHGFTSFTGQPKNEASMDPQSKATAFRHEFLRLPSVQTLAHSLQYIVTSRFKADHEVANPCFLHFSQNVAW